jgi:hypothetical protein
MISSGLEPATFWLVAARASSIYIRQIRPLVREGAPQKQDRNCQTVINIWSWAPDGARHPDLLTDWPTDRQSQCDFDSDLTLASVTATLTLREPHNCKATNSKHRQPILSAIASARQASQPRQELCQPARYCKSFTRHPAGTQSPSCCKKERHH